MFEFIQIETAKKKAEREFESASESFERIVKELQPVEQSIQKIHHELDGISKITVELGMSSLIHYSYCVTRSYRHQCTVILCININ